MLISNNEFSTVGPMWIVSIMWCKWVTIGNMKYYEKIKLLIMIGHESP